MKKIIPLIMIICLLLPSCQLKKSEYSYDFTTVPVPATVSEFFEEDSEPVCTEAENESSTTASSGVAATVLSSAVHSTKNSSTVSSAKPSEKITAKQTTGKPATTKATTVKTTVSTTKAPSVENELRGIWISCYDYTSAAGKTRAQYKATTHEMFRNIRDCGLNTAFVHLRAFSDAFYESDIYPYSAYIAGKEGAALSFDPFEVLLESANKYGISVHGWINPFRVSTKKDVSLLSNSNPAKKIIDAGNENGEICILSNGIYYNPSCTENHARILDGVREIITKYDIDGIHIDDYFYPSTDEKVDKIQYSEYKSEGGKLSLSEWRKANVNSFVSALYSTVKSYNNSLTVSISPSAKLDENENKLYADVKLWLSKKGYADIIIPQIYFGFEHETHDFKKLLAQWGNLPRNPDIKLICGIAAYKCNTADNYAGKGKKEWQENSDILTRQAECIQKNSNYGGFVVFSYQDLTRNGCKNEISNLKNTIKTGKD